MDGMQNLKYGSFISVSPCLGNSTAILTNNIFSVTNNEELKAKVFDMEESLQDERQFKEFYSFVFPFAKTKSQKSMDVEV
jgi:hypothetical protein